MILLFSFLLKAYVYYFIYIYKLSCHCWIEVVSLWVAQRFCVKILVLIFFFFFYYLFPAYTTHCTFLLFTHLFHMFMWWGGVLINLLNSSVQGKKEHNTQLLFYQKIIQSLINLIHLSKSFCIYFNLLFHLFYQFFILICLKKKNQHITCMIIMFS